MVNQCVVPNNNWNLIRPQQQRQEEEEVVLLAVEGDEEEIRNRSSSHVHSSTEQNLTYVAPMPNYEVTTELTWENGQLGWHGLGGTVPTPSAQTKQLQTWTTNTNTNANNNNNNKPVDTLESIVHQATSANNHLPQYHHHHHHQSSSHMQMEQQTPAGSLMEAGKWRENNNGNINCGGKWRENNSDGEKKLMMMSSMASSSGNKRVRSESNYNNNNNNCGRSKSNFDPMEDQSACASASATFCRDNDTTMMTWPSFESPRSMKTTAPNNADDDSAYQDCSENQEGERMTKGESFRSQSSTRRSRAATVHNQSERRRRDRINEKMKALQKLVPNASKTDKASMLDEVIEYLKQLQSQVHMMSNARNMPQMVMPSQLGMQHQIQMSLLARMGMGMGMGMDIGMLDVARNHMPQSFPHHQLIHATAPPLGGTTNSFVPPPFTMAPLKANVNGASVPNFNDAYNTYIAQQSMNMDFLNKMSALYRQQQANQAQQMTSKKAVNSSMPNHGQGD